jgi:tetratricopeptide (TPR) repeat protein
MEEKELEELKGKTAEDLLLVGEDLLEKGQLEDAIRIYKEIVKKEPRRPTLAKACNDCGAAYASLKMYEMAIGFFNAALNLKEYLMDEGISTYYNLGRVYQTAGDEERAELCFKNAEKLKQEHKRSEDELKRAFDSEMW